VLQDRWVGRWYGCFSDIDEICTVSAFLDDRSSMNLGFKMGPVEENKNYVYCKIQHAEVSIHVYINDSNQGLTNGRIPHAI
jgi:hypothetical protein